MDDEYIPLSLKEAEHLIIIECLFGTTHWYKNNNNPSIHRLKDLSLSIEEALKALYENEDLLREQGILR